MTAGEETLKVGGVSLRTWRSVTVGVEQRGITATMRMKSWWWWIEHDEGE